MSIYEDVRFELRSCCSERGPAYRDILLFLCLIDILLISLTDSHWDSVVICRGSRDLLTIKNRRIFLFYAGGFCFGALEFWF